MLLDKEGYERYFKGFTVLDCSIRSRDVLCFVLISDYDDEGDDPPPPPPDEDRVTKVVSYFAKEKKQWTFASFSGFNLLRAGASVYPLEQFIGVDGDGQVIAMGSGRKDHEPRVPGGKQGPRRGGIRKARTIDGYLHVSSGYRGLGRRDAPGKWTSLSASLDFEPLEDQSSDEYGFDDFDAFEGGDFYAVGGRGDVYRYDRKAWEAIDFPSNMVLESVCCAGDGYVYIGAQNGTVFKGRRDEWTMIHKGDLTLPFRDMVWFNDRVYCTSDYGLWEIQGDEVRESQVDPDIKICSGNLYAADGIMLLAGVYGAAFHDGTTWTRVFDVPTLA